MCDAVWQNAASDDVYLYIGVDEDDSSYDGFLFEGSHVMAVVGPRQQLAGWTNTLAELALADGHEILASFGDDHRPRTFGWDKRVLEAFNERGKGLVYTRDGLQDENLPTAPFWSSEIIAALGWYFPPILKHLWADNFWHAFADALGRRFYLDDVLIQHLHPSAPDGNAYDAVNAGNDEHELEDRHNFHAFLGTREYQACLERVRAIL